MWFYVFSINCRYFLTVVSDRIATQAAALDIFKAFNRVCHAGLLHKRKSYGISGQIFGLISYFLSIRIIISILDLTLFLLDINDLPDDAILLSMLMILTSILSVIRHLMWQQLESAFELECGL